ncbi:transposase [Paenibacillus sp. MER TA 81-3]|uniref:transposase n=1 Tax=Paenibacillus sp. MER TA 81-3 TaxID=2939573 RepID=UPI00203E3C77|nr:transposase [Paenibacillus sp. MER TA 81-3]MCM3340576.1 transposase [Paenibacillus sp. MER TA 81-3]
MGLWTKEQLRAFEPIVVRKNQTSIIGIQDQIIALYAKGVSTREIQDHPYLQGCDRGNGIA